MRPALAAAVVAALAGCATTSVQLGVGIGMPVGGDVRVGAEVSAFATPAGASAQRRSGELLSTEPAAVHLDDPGRPPPVGLHLVSRDRALKPSAILRVSEVRQSVAFVVVERGNPARGDEVVEATEAYRLSVEAQLSGR